MEKTTFLIAHVDKNGHNAAQVAIPAETEFAAKEQFKALYPERDILTTGIEGVEG